MLTSSLKLALKVLARRKVFTAISLVGISLTLVVLLIATAIFDNILTPRAPLSKLDRLVTVSTVSERGANATRTSNPGRGFLDKTVRNLPGVEAVSYVGEPQYGIVYDGDRRVELPMRRVDGAFWRIADFHFLQGGAFGDADAESGRAVVVITEETAAKLFGSASALGRNINIGGQQHRVVGVVPTVPVSQMLAYAAMWVPLGPGTSDERTSMFGGFEGVVLARTKGDIAAIQREFRARVARMPVDDPKTYDEFRSNIDTTFEGLARALTGNQFGERGPTVLRIAFLVLALLFMSLPALNLVTLNLSRILERAPEVGVRKAFGAPPAKLVGQFVLENVVLTLLGGAIAFVLAFFALRGLSSLDLVPGARFEMNPRVFVYGMLIAAFFGVFSGAYPAWKMSRLNPVTALRGGAL